MRITLSACIVLLFFIQNTGAQDTLDVHLNKKHLVAGDTLSADCYLKTNSPAKTATLNVWIESVDKKMKWRFRYPIVNGIMAFDLKVGDSLPGGHYAVNFLVQPAFFSLEGKIENYDKKMREVNMVMLTRDSEQVLSTITPDLSGNFSTSKFVFEDTAKFTFYPTSKKEPDLVVNIQNNLDSAFTPLITHTEMISVGDTALENKTDEEYTFKKDVFTRDKEVLS